MNFLSPAAFFLSLLLPVIVIMYLLKLRRQTQKVSSTFLWRQLVRDVEANAPWQKLRRNLIMILQLLFLAALIFALAEPFTLAEGAGGDAMILILDNSASMSATDAEPTRLEAAKMQARSFVEQAPEDTRITLIEAGAQTEILVSASQDRRQVQQAINGIQQGAGTSDISTALQLTAAITLRQPNTDIYIFSDGRNDFPERLNLNGDLYYYPIGFEGTNQGISNIQLEQNPSGDNSTLFVQVSNFSSENTERRLEIYVDDALFDAATLDINGYAQEAYFAESIPADAQTIYAYLSGEDFLALDDTAWAVPQNLDLINILLVTTGNRFLESAFGLLPNVALTVLNPTEFPQDTEAEAPDLFVFDQFTPTEDQLPDTSILFIAPTSSTPFFSITSTVDQPIPRKTDPNDTLLAGIAINGVSILDAASIPLPNWAKMAVSGDTSLEPIPLLFYGTTQGQKIAVLSFQLQHSDLPLQVAFPLLIANLTNWLAPSPINSDLEGISFSTLAFTPPLGTTEVEITAPNGSTSREIPGENGLVLLENSFPGIYQIQWGENANARVAVNFFSAEESDIKPLGQLDLSGIENNSQELTINQAKRVFWRPIAFLALTLITAEWMVYHRGTLSKIWLGLTRKEQI